MTIGEYIQDTAKWLEPELSSIFTAEQEKDVTVQAALYSLNAGVDNALYCAGVDISSYKVDSADFVDGKTVVSEGIDANYMDMINYAVFGLIKTVLENK